MLHRKMTVLGLPTPSPLDIVSSCGADVYFSGPNACCAIENYIAVVDWVNKSLAIRDENLNPITRFSFSGAGDITAGRGMYYNSVTRKLYIANANYVNIYDVVISAGYISITYNTRFGGSGSGNGQFSTARGLAGDGTYLYVADSGNNRYQVFLESDNSYITQVGSLGSGDDQFSAPSGICLAGGFMFLTDVGNDRLMKRNDYAVDHTMAYVAKIGSLGSGNDNFSNPYSVKTNGTHLFITEEANNRVQKRLNSDLSYVAQVSTGAASYPYFLAVLNGYLFVPCYAANSVKKIDTSTMTVTVTTGSSGSAAFVFTAVAYPPKSYKWSFPDGKVSYGSTASKTFLNAANNTIRLSDRNIQSLKIPLATAVSPGGEFKTVDTADTVLLSKWFGGLLRDAITDELVVHDTSKTYIYYEDGVDGKDTNVSELNLSNMSVAEGSTAIAASTERFITAHLVLRISDSLYVAFYTSFPGSTYPSAIAVAQCATPNGEFAKQGIIMAHTDADALPWEYSLETNCCWLFDSQDSNYIYGYIGYENMGVGKAAYSLSDPQTWYQMSWAKVKIAKADGIVTYLGRFGDRIPALDPNVAEPDSYRHCFYGGGNYPTKLGDYYAMYYFGRSIAGVNTNFRALSTDPFFRSFVILQELPLLGSPAEKIQHFVYNSKLYLIWQDSGGKKTYYKIFV